jgi:hypothetical protein
MEEHEKNEWMLTAIFVLAAVSLPVTIWHLAQFVIWLVSS